MTFAATPQPPYYAVIFSSRRTKGDNGYGEMAQAMVTLAAQQPGYLGIESAAGAPNITVSYWESLEAIANWKRNFDHLVAQKRGRADWYQDYKVRISRVERDYSFEKP